MSDETKIINPFTDTEPSLPVDPNAISRLVNGKSLNIGAGNTAFKVDRSGGWAGANKFEDAPFKFDMLGNTRVNVLTNKTILFETITAPAVPTDGQLWCADNLSNKKVLWGYFGGDTTNKQQISMSRMQKSYSFDLSSSQTIDITNLWFQPRMVIFNGFIENAAADKYGVTNGQAGVVSPLQGYCNAILLDLYTLNNVISDITFGSTTAMDCDGVTCKSIPIVTGYLLNSLLLVSQVKIGIITDSLGASSVDKEVYLYVNNWGNTSVQLVLSCSAGWRMAGNLTIIG